MDFGASLQNASFCNKLQRCDRTPKRWEYGVQRAFPCFELTTFYGALWNHAIFGCLLFEVQTGFEIGENCVDSFAGLNSKSEGL
jgi:hypothetical protein